MRAGHTYGRVQVVSARNLSGELPIGKFRSLESRSQQCCSALVLQPGRHNLIAFAQCSTYNVASQPPFVTSPETELHIQMRPLTL